MRIVAHLVVSQQSESILAFLIEVDRKDQQRIQRNIKSRAEIMRERERDLESQIERMNSEIGKLAEAESKIIELQNDYSGRITNAQLQIESKIREKEALATKLAELTQELETITKYMNEDPSKKVAERVRSSISSEIRDLRDKFDLKIRAIAEESSMKAAKEFAPHINRLKIGQSSEIESLKAANARQLSDLNIKLRSEMVAELEEIRSRPQQKVESISNMELIILQRRNEMEIESCRREIEAAKSSTEAIVAKVTRQYQIEADRIRGNAQRKLDECSSDVASTRRILEKQAIPVPPMRDICLFFEAELEKKCEEEKNAAIESKTDEISSENERFSNQIKRSIPQKIDEANRENSILIAKLSDEIKLCASEREKLQKVVSSLRKLRMRHQSESLFLSSESERAKSLISGLRDMINELSHPLGPLKPYSDDPALRMELSALESSIASEKRIHIAKIAAIKSSHEADLHQAAARVKQAIDDKDKAIAILTGRLSKISCNLEAIKKEADAHF